MTGLGQPEKIWHRDNVAGLPSTAEMLTDGSTFSQCELPKFAVHPMTIIPKAHSPIMAQMAIRRTVQLTRPGRARRRADSRIG